MQMATITPKELAVKLDANPRTVRKFLRSPEGMNMKVGKGQRWAIEARAVNGLKKRFTAWSAAQVKVTIEGADAPIDDAPDAD